MNRRTRELSHEDIQKIAGTYHAWRTGEGGYEDIKGFCASTPIERVKERFAALKAEFEAQLIEEAELNKAIARNLARIEI
ncbi:MAG: N-6 DNA methylase [Methylococcales bacterium]|nr:N-6 DNA methylase [Methylococcales bacterium]